MMLKLFLFVLASAASVKCQRPPYAGTRPIGYPVVTTAATTEGLGDRFGEDVTTTTQRLPLEANGDRDLVDRLSKLPIDKQPFWFINWQALEAHRQKPQTYPLKPNPFIEPGVSNSDNVQVPNSGNVGIPNAGNVGIPNAGNVGNSNAGNVPNSGNTGLGNRNSGNTGSANTGIAVPSSNSNTPIAITNRNSASASNENSANGIAASSNSASSFGTIADRFNDGIEVNRYFETQPLSTNLGSGSSNHKPGNTVN